MNCDYPVAPGREGGGEKKESRLSSFIPKAELMKCLYLSVKGLSFMFSSKYNSIHFHYGDGQPIKTNCSN